MKLNMKQKLDANPSHINPVLQPFYYFRKGRGEWGGRGGRGGGRGGGVEGRKRQSKTTFSAEDFP